jgi:Uma2 family endonuclease
MAMKIPASTPQPWCVNVYLPDETETQILGGNDAHSAAGYNLNQTLRTYSERVGKIWLVRFESELRYPRTVGKTGVFFPDLLMTPDVRLDPEAPYDVRKVGRPPALVVEILSNKTASKDVGLKLEAYAEMGVEEYVTFDPRPRRGRELRGYRLDGRRYVAMPPASEGGVWLNTIGLRMEAEAPLRPFGGPLLRLSTPEGQRLLHMDEEAEARDAAEEAHEVAERLRRSAERAMEAERTARAAAERDRETEKQARSAAEQAYAAGQAEITRLRALLDRSPDQTEQETT